MKLVFDLEKPEIEGFIQPGTIYIYRDTRNDCKVRRIFLRSLVETFEKVVDEIVDIDNGELLKGSIDKQNIFIAKGKHFGIMILGCKHESSKYSFFDHTKGLLKVRCY